jgi:hypothetical protein
MNTQTNTKNTQTCGNTVVRISLEVLWVGQCWCSYMSQENARKNARKTQENAALRILETLITIMSGVKDEDNLFGENETSSTTHGRWHLRIDPQMHYKLLDGSKTIVIDQNSKVCHYHITTLFSNYTKAILWIFTTIL